VRVRIARLPAITDSSSTTQRTAIRATPRLDRGMRARLLGGRLAFRLLFKLIFRGVFLSGCDLGLQALEVFHW
jgi:hypothetical protein